MNPFLHNCMLWIMYLLNHIQIQSWMQNTLESHSNSEQKQLWPNYGPFGTQHFTSASWKITKTIPLCQVPFLVDGDQCTKNTVSFYDKRSEQKKVQWLKRSGLQGMWYHHFWKRLFHWVIYLHFFLKSGIKSLSVNHLVPTRFLTHSVCSDLLCYLIYIANLINTTATNALCFALQQPSAMFANEAFQKPWK